MEGTYDHTSLYTCMKFTRISKSFKSEKKNTSEEWMVDNKQTYLLQGILR